MEHQSTVHHCLSVGGMMLWKGGREGGQPCLLCVEVALRKFILSFFFSAGQVHLILDAFTKILKVIISFVWPVRLSICYEQFGSHGTDFM
jgi:hypothetical protein